MKKLKSIGAIILALALFASFATVAFADSGVTRWNISRSHATCNASSGGLPASVDSAAPGSTLYANFQVSTEDSLRFNKATLYLRGPGQSSYTQMGVETARNFMRYCWLDFTIPSSFKSGQADYYWLIHFNSGREQKFSGSITITGTSTNSGTSVSSRISNFLNDSRFKEGTSWGYYQRPKVSSYSSMGCCAYTADYVKVVFGKDSPRSGSQYSRASDMREGDVVVMSPQHWFIVISRNGNTIKVAEGNYDSRVHIGTYTISGNSILRPNGSTYKTFSTGYHYC